jgi:hypothetical protein
VGELTSDEDTLRNHLTQHFSSLVAKHDGWQTLKAKGDSYDQHFACKADNMEFVLDALTKYPQGKRDGKSQGAIRHLHLAQSSRYPNMSQQGTIPYEADGDHAYFALRPRHVSQPFSRGILQSTTFLQRFEALASIQRLLHQGQQAQERCQKSPTCVSYDIA